MTISNTPHIVERLKACPFCRSEDVRTLPGLRRVLCFNPKCDAEMGGNTQADAIAAWNTRTPDPVITAYEAALRVVAERLSIEAQITCDPISEEARLRAKMGDCASTLFAALSSEGTQP